MEPRDFDRLARFVGSGQSRRRVLKTLAGGALGAVAAALGLGETNAARLRSAGNSCTANGDCASGLCVQEGRTRKICHCASPADCPVSSDQCRPAACLPNGYCGTPITVGTSCDDHNACTTNDVCRVDGSCAGTPKVCAASDQCHTAGTCDPASGQCSNPARPDGAACDDGDPSTCNDVCTNGTCAGALVDLTSDDDNCGACGNVCAGVGVLCNSSQCCQASEGFDASCSADAPCCFSSDICNENGYCCLVGGTGACYTDDISGSCCGVCVAEDPSCDGHCPGVCCDPDDQATTCAGKCGTQTNNCGQSVACGGCAAGQLCTGGTCVAGQGTCVAGQNYCSDTIAGCNGEGDCNCRIATEGDTRCGGNGLGGDCGECGSSADCATLYPSVPGAFCMAGGTGCCNSSAPRGLCTAPCPTA